MKLNQDASARWRDSAVDIGEHCRRMVADGLALGTAGNLSCRVDDHVIISPSSVPYGKLEPQDMWVLSLDGEVEQEGSAAPSSETPFHLAVYGSTKAGAVVHTHSPEVVAVSTTLDELPAIHYAIARLGGPVPVVRYQRFGSDSLAAEVRAALTGGVPRSAAILQNHGAVTYGRNLAEAYEKALLLEWLARVFRLARQIGEPRILSTEELDEVMAEAMRRRYSMAPRDGETR